MITNVPDPADFEQTGLDYLNLAADQVFSVLWNREATGFDDTWDVELRQFWEVAQRPLTSALTLVAQGTEFLMQATIARVSPFLLLVGGPRDWPRQCDSRDIPFAQFRTIDAQDLVKAYNTVSRTRLAPEFAQQFEQLRQRRNTIMHTVDRSLQVTAKEILLLALEAMHELVAPNIWIPLRREYLYRTPSSTAGGDEFVESQMVQEAAQLIALLTRSELLRYFRYRKNQRSYICPVCRSRDEYGDKPPFTAQLQPNTPTSTNLHCFVCRENIPVRREDCPNPQCRGNVIGEQAAQCLSCVEEVSSSA